MHLHRWNDANLYGGVHWLGFFTLFSPNELLCQVPDESGSFGGEADPECSWMLLQSAQQLWWADVWEAGSCAASSRDGTGQKVVSLENSQDTAAPESPVKYLEEASH